VEILDKEVFRTMETVAKMGPALEKVVEFFDSGALEEKIQKTVEDEMKGCPCTVGA